MKSSGIKVLNYLKSNYPNEKSREEIVEATGASALQVQAALTGFGSLKSMGFLNTRVVTEELEPAIEPTETTRGRKAKIKTITYYSINEDGLAFDPTEAETEDK